ncbi:hypothetical protein [Neobacillus vireti]|uniref:hypothetical protein n=1 Tax=Neobacillus vireti TaxID=220686 RepID=UPI002FFDC4FC
MVTAILIPIICLYFFWITRKERKEQDRKWHKAGDVRQESVVIGKIIDITEEKQRFYYDRYVLVQSIKLQSSNRVITALKTTPLTTDAKKDTFTVGETVRLYGRWERSHFLFTKWVIERD